MLSNPYPVGDDMKSSLVGLILIAALGACTPETEEGPMPTPPKAPAPVLSTKECPAADLQHLIGQTYNVDLIDHDGRLRVIRPGQPVTMDYIPNRLNVSISQHRLILRITCG